MSSLRLRLYRVADPGWTVGRNIYDYRPDGGKRYVIGVYVLLGARCSRNSRNASLKHRYNLTRSYRAEGRQLHPVGAQGEAQ